MPEYKLPIDANRLSDVLENYTMRQAEAIQWLYDLMIENQWGFRQAGDFLNYDSSTPSRIFNGKYPGTIEPFIEKLIAFKEDWIMNHGIITPDFIETANTKDMFFACDKALNNREVALAYGDIGSSKTKSGEEYCKRNPRESHYFRCKSSEAFGSFIRSFGRSLGLKQGSIDSLRTNIIAKLKRKKTRLIFFDELHLPFTTTSDKISLKYVEYIRDLHDELDCGIVLCGSNVLLKTIKDNIWAAALEQILDRGNTRVFINKYSQVSDLADFFQYYNLPTKPTDEAYKLMNNIITKRSLRSLVFALRDGKNAADKMEQPYSWDHFIDAYVINKSLSVEPKKTA